MSGNYLPIESELDMTVNIDTNYAKQIYIEHFQIEDNPAYYFIFENVIIQDTSGSEPGVLCLKTILIDTVMDQIALYLETNNGNIIWEEHPLVFNASNSASSFSDVSSSPDLSSSGTQKEQNNCPVVTWACPCTLNTYYNGVKTALTDCIPDETSSYQLQYWEKLISVQRDVALEPDETDPWIHRDAWFDVNNIWGENNDIYENYITDAFWAATMFMDYFVNTLHYRYNDYVPYNGFQPDEDCGNFIIFTANHDNTYLNKAAWVSVYPDPAHLPTNYVRENYIIVGYPTAGYKPMVALDIISHEFAHSFAYMAAELRESAMDRIITEASSDIWAAVVEAAVAPEKSKWQIGEEVMPLHETKLFERDLSYPKNPDAQTQMIDCYAEFDENNPSPDNRYINSGLISHWFYLLSEGGQGENCDGICYDFEGIGIENAARLFFECENVHLFSGMTIQQFKLATLQAAMYLDVVYGYPDYAPQVIKAWEAVGMYSAYPFNGNVLYPYSSIYNAPTITGNVVWDEDLYIHGNVTILPGATLTVTSTVAFTKNSSIIVNPGGKLIVDGGTLTALNNCEGIYNMWEGVRVEGNSSLRQSYTNQGVVILQNGATIENANIGIATWVNNETGEIDYTTSGGIIQATDAVFSNNKNAIEFIPFTNRNSLGNEISNLSYFTKCTFLIDDNNFLAANGYSFTLHVHLYAVSDIKFKGCLFYNNLPLSNPQSGRGIASYGAGFTVDEFCPGGTYTGCSCPQTSTRSYFYGFYEAIEANESSDQKTFTVDHTDFENNYLGIVSNGVNNFTVIRSGFNLPVLSYLITIGIKMTTSSGYTIEENMFYASDENNTMVYKTPIGINVIKSGRAENIIRRNIFENLFYGIYAENINSYYNTSAPTGLQFECNDFSGNYIDILNKGTVRYWQGSSLIGADNNFLNHNHCRNLVNNGTAPILYYYSNATEHIPTIAYQQLIGLRVATNPNDCISSICEQEETSQLEALTAYNLLETEYEKAIEDFYAAGYDKILDSIYNLNMSMMNQENTISSLLSNSNSITNNTTTASSSSPPVSLVELAENQMSLILSLSSQMRELSDYNIRYILNDTIKNDDFLEEWHTIVNSPVAKYCLAGDYFYTGEYEKAEALLSSIPALFDLDESELIEHDNFVNFYNFRDTVQLSGRNVAQLNEDEIAELEVIATNNDGLSATLAKNILCFFYDICYDDGTDSVTERNLFQNTQNIQNNLNVKVYPNPTENQLNILFDSSLDEKAQIEIYDITGRCVQKEILSDIHCVINLGNLTDGIYFYRINYKNNLIARDKVIKQ